MKKTIYSALFATAMLFATTSAFAQVKIGTNPTVIEATSNLEVEASTAGRKVSINKTSGKVTIADGSQGATKVLTSDANGVATWEAPVQTASVYVDVSAPVGQTITATNTNLGYNKLILTTETVDRGGNYDPATSEVTIPSDGLYLVTGGTSKTSVSSGGLCISLSLIVNGGSALSDLLDGGTGCGASNDGQFHFRGSVLRHFSANDKVYLMLRSIPGGGTLTNLFQGSFLKLTKLSN